MIKRVWKSDGTPIKNIIDGISVGKITSFIGGGGKTSSMLAIGRELASRNQEVIMTTSTQIMPFEEALPDHLHCRAKKGENGKFQSLEDPDSLKEVCDYLLIEADGSRGLPIKAPAGHEPVITNGTDLVIAVIGLKGIGRPIGQACHRPELICRLLGKGEDDLIQPQDVIKLILHPNGYYKKVKNRRYALILNQADHPLDRELGCKIAKNLPREIPCIMTSYRR